MAEVTVKAWKCDVCGWTWIPESASVPVQCPSRKCRSSKWNSGKGPKAEKMIIAKPEKLRVREIKKPKPAKLAPCPRCDGPTVDWGSQRRCQKCLQNWPK